MLVIVAILVLLALAIYLYYNFQGSALRGPQHKPLRGNLGYGYENMELAEDYTFDLQRLRTEKEDFLPGSYGVDRLVLLAKDPDWLYTYWEITEDTKKLFTEKTKENAWQDSQPILRIFDLTAGSHFDIKINDESDNWYIRAGRPNTKFRAELGRVYEGKYYPLLRSNQVTSPAFGVSAEIDPEWAPIDEIWQSLAGTYKTAYGSNHLCKNEH